MGNFIGKTEERTVVEERRLASTLEQVLLLERDWAVWAEVSKLQLFFRQLRAPPKKWINGVGTVPEDFGIWKRRVDCLRLEVHLANLADELVQLLFAVGNQRTLMRLTMSSAAEESMLEFTRCVPRRFWTIGVRVLP